VDEKISSVSAVQAGGDEDDEATEYDMAQVEMGLYGPTSVFMVQ